MILRALGSCLFLLAGMIFGPDVIAQPKFYHQWYFGNKAGISFHTSPPSALHDGAMQTGKSSSGICDSLGNLLFYTNGDVVYNRNHQLMLNGNTGNYNCQSAIQGSMALPVPGDPRKYYLIMGLSYFDYQNYFNLNGIDDTITFLTYAIIDMDGDGGLGAVTVKQQPLLPQPFQRFAVTRHQNDTDYWVASINETRDMFVSRRTVNGAFTAPIISSPLPSRIYHSFESLGDMKFSPDGRTVAFSCENEQGKVYLIVYKFDRSSGIISNPINLGLNTFSGGAIEFSSNSRFLYLHKGTNLGSGQLIQYDLDKWNEAAANASAYVVAGYKDPIMGMQLGPDGSIYGFRHDKSDLFVIRDPNEKGVLCHFELNGPDVLPEKNAEGYPYYPTFWFRAINLPDDTIICTGDSVRIPVFGLRPSTRLIWSTGDTTTSIVVSQAGKYWVKDISRSKVDVDTIEIKIQPPPTVYLGADTAFCKAFAHVLNAGKQKSYLWNTGETTMKITVTDSGEYSVQVADALSCKNGDTIHVDKLPPPELSLRYDSTDCPYVYLSVTNRRPGVAYTWNTGDTGTVLRAREKGMYTVVADHMFCSNTDSIAVTELPAGEADLGPDTTLCDYPSITVFEPGVYLWNTGETTATIQPKKAGIYWVDVTRIGCTVRDSVNVLPCQDMTLYIPSGFTPNNDGLNEVFSVSGAGIKRIHLQVYNRWGEKVYDEDGPYISWDGTYRNTECSEGVYMYIIAVWGYRNNQQVPKYYKGNITLLR